jgi:hypothetical protein
MPSVQAEPSIYEQFPLQCHVVANLYGGKTKKITAFKAFLRSNQVRWGVCVIGCVWAAPQLCVCVRACVGAHALLHACEARAWDCTVGVHEWLRLPRLFPPFSCGYSKGCFTAVRVRLALSLLLCASSCSSP